MYLPCYTHGPTCRIRSTTSRSSTSCAVLVAPATTRRRPPPTPEFRLRIPPHLRCRGPATIPRRCSAGLRPTPAYVRWKPRLGHVAPQPTLLFVHGTRRRTRPLKRASADAFLSSGSRSYRYATGHFPHLRTRPTNRCSSLGDSMAWSVNGANACAPMAHAIAPRLGARIAGPSPRRVCFPVSAAPLPSEFRRHRPVWRGSVAATQRHTSGERPQSSSCTPRRIRCLQQTTPCCPSPQHINSGMPNLFPGPKRGSHRRAASPRASGTQSSPYTGLALRVPTSIYRPPPLARAQSIGQPTRR